MKQDLHEWKPGKAAVAVLLLLVTGFFTARMLKTQASHPVLLCLCDGFCVGGLLYLFFAVLRAAVAAGYLDGFFYIVHITANLLSTERGMRGKPRYVPFREYRGSLERRKRSVKPLVLLGGASFLLSLLLFAVWRLLP